MSSYPGLSPPSSFTSMARVATGPLTEGFQCWYFAGSVRKSTMILEASSAMLAVLPWPCAQPRITQSALALRGPRFSQPCGVPPSR